MRIIINPISRPRKFCDTGREEGSTSERSFSLQSARLTGKVVSTICDIQMSVHKAKSNMIL